MKKAEKARIERMLQLGCCACAKIGIPNYHTLEVHHMLSGGERMGHWFTLPLCKGHHQRGCFTAVQKLTLKPKQLVSIGDGRPLFNKVYGTERKLWTGVQFVLGLDDTWPTSKIVPRRAA